MSWRSFRYPYFFNPFERIILNSHPKLKQEFPLSLKGVPMRTIVYSTSSAIFKFPQADTLLLLRFCVSQTKVKEARKILSQITRSQSAGEVIITLPYFAYIVLELLKKDKGLVLCRDCQATYPAGDLIPFSLGFGPTPFQINFEPAKKLMKSLFGRKFKGLRTGMFGGQGFRCPKDHELISAITWLN
jgi:hypothetical protein